MKVNVLALETATAACSVALMYESCWYVRHEIAPRRHTDLILPMITEVLDEAGAGLNQLNTIAFGCGPGSFMGVRLATSVAQGLAYGANLPVVAVSTLQALAQQAYNELGKKMVLAGLDARLSEIYWGGFRYENQLMELILAEQISKPADIHCTDELDWIAAGNAWQVYKDNLSPDFKKILHKIHPGIFPHAKAVAEIAIVKYQAGETVSSLMARPVYLRNHVADQPKTSDH